MKNSKYTILSTPKAKPEQPKVSTRKDYSKPASEKKKTERKEKKTTKPNTPNIEQIKESIQKKKEEDLKARSNFEKEKAQLKEVEKIITTEKKDEFEEKYKEIFLEIVSSMKEKNEKKNITILKEILEEIEEIENDDIFEMIQELCYQLIRVLKTERGFYLKTDSIESLISILTVLNENRIPISMIQIDSIKSDDEITIKEQSEHFQLLLSYKAKNESNIDEKWIIQSDSADEIVKKVDAHFSTFEEDVAVFPCSLTVLNVDHDLKFIEVKITDGRIKIGTPLAMHIEGDQEHPEDTIDFGKISMISENDKSVKIKLDGELPETLNKKYPLVSRISRKSIDSLKLHFKDEITYQDAILIQKLKKKFKIQ
jgi:hypothetical protein